MQLWNTKVNRSLTSKNDGLTGDVAKKLISLKI